MNEFEKYRVKKMFEEDVIRYPDINLPEHRTLLRRLGNVDTRLIPNKENRKCYKDLMYSCITDYYPFKPQTHCFLYVFRMFPYFVELGDKSFLTHPRKELQEQFYAYCKRIGAHKEMAKCFYGSWLYLQNLYDEREGFDRDYWDSSVYQITDERFNKAAPQTSISFYDIEYEPNRKYAKTYIKYLLSTEQANSTIYNKHRRIINFISWLKEKDLSDITKEDIIPFFSELNDRSDNYYNQYFDIISAFFKYLFVKGLIDKKIELSKSKRKKDKRKDPIIRSWTDEEIFQVFNNIHKAPFSIMLMFLINFTTGTRISDLCQIKKDCLYFDGTDGYYISYWSQKMKKDQRNLIPKSLYELIQEQIKILNSKEEQSEWLFPSVKDINSPCRANYYSHSMKSLCLEWGIKANDGTPFHFQSHGLRHTVATTLYDKFNVDATIIQLKVLQHKELDMTVGAYIERPDAFKRLQEDKYIDKVGESRLAKWMVDTLQGRILTNGICGQPEVLDACPNGNACLSCEFFKTSKEFLPALRSQLKTIEERLPLYEANNWIHNIATAKEDISVLKELINKLEKGG